MSPPGGRDSPLFRHFRSPRLASYHPQQMTNIVITSDWAPDPEGRGVAVRHLSYNKPTPVGPTPVIATQKVRSAAKRGTLANSTEEQ